MIFIRILQVEINIEWNDVSFVTPKLEIHRLNTTFIPAIMLIMKYRLRNPREHCQPPLRRVYF